MYDVRMKRGWESEEAVLFRDMVRRFLETEAVPLDEKWREQKFVDRDFWKRAGEVGILCPSVPDAYGGGGGDFSLEAVVAEELSYAGITSFLQLIHGTIVAHYLVAYGSQEQKARWLPGMASLQKRFEGPVRCFSVSPGAACF